MQNEHSGDCLYDSSLLIDTSDNDQDATVDRLYLIKKSVINLDWSSSFSTESTFLLSEDIFNYRVWNYKKLAPYSSFYIPMTTLLYRFCE